MALKITKPSKYIQEKLLTDVAGEVFSFVGEEYEVGLKFACLNCIKKLNKDYRGLDEPTNVLSFNASTDTKNGDILICEAVVEEEASKLGYEPEELILLYLVHGMLHLAGYDHQKPQERDKMEKIEAEILSKFGIIIER